MAPAGDEVELGILAGGAGSRVGGQDKAWMPREGSSQVEWLVGRVGLGRVRIASSRSIERYLRAGLERVDDLLPGFAGPLAGLAALLSAQSAPVLLCLPVDLGDWVPAAGEALVVAARDGQPAFLVDADGRQPLVAAYPLGMAGAAVEALRRGERSVRSWQDGLGARAVPMPGVRLGNRNRREDYPG